MTPLTSPKISDTEASAPDIATTPATIIPGGEQRVSSQNPEWKANLFGQFSPRAQANYQQTLSDQRFDE
jgi:hypothetical protein